MVRRTTKATKSGTRASSHRAALASKKFTGAAFELLPMVVAFFDRDLRFRFVNREFERWYEVRREDALGKRIDQVCPKKTYAKLGKYIEKARAGQKARFLGRVGYPDGVTRYVRAEFIPSQIAGGKPEGILAIVTDLSREKAFERELLRSQADLSRAQRVARLGSWDWNIVTNELHWSDQIYRIFGLEPQQFAASYPAFLERVHPEDRTLVEAAVSRALQERVPYSIDHRIVLPGGEVRIVHEHGEATYSHRGRPLRMTGTVLDVTEQRASQDALARSQTMLSGILNISPEAIIIIDSSLRILLFSSGAERVFGHAGKDVLGRRIDCLMPARYYTGHARHVEQFAASPVSNIKMAERGEIIGLRKNGEEFPAEASLSKLSTKDGYVFTVILRDITAQRAAQQALMAAKLKAEAASQSKSAFLANMSHELRTPLNAVIGFSEILAQQIFGPLGNEKYRDYATDILKSGHHLLAVINDILDISRIELGKTQIQENVVAVEDMIDDCARMMRPHAADSGIEFRVEIGAALPKLRVDRRLINQVLLNLLSNAVKFTPQGGRVEIGAARGADGGIEITVRDNGIGMTEQSAARLGEPFVQADERLSRQYEGTGLGFSIAKGLAELHGGDLRVISALAEGTTVTLRLPPERIADATPLAEPSPARAEA